MNGFFLSFGFSNGDGAVVADDMEWVAGLETECFADGAGQCNLKTF